MPVNYLDLANKMLGAAAAIVKVLPVVGGAGDLLEAAQKIVTAAEDAKKNKRLLEELAKDAASEASAVIQAVKSAQGEKANTSEGIKDLLRVYGEVEILCRQLGRRRPFIASMCNAGSDTEAIDDLRKQLKDARERYMLTTMARTDHRLDQLRDATDDVRLKDGLRPLLEGRFDHVNSPSGCMPGTREETLKTLMDWASLDPDQFGVYWLTGMAGTGKTTIAKSFCTMLAKTTLCSTFFISRNDKNRRNHQNFITTIAYGLARQHRDIYDGVIAALKQEPDIRHRTIEEQVKALITGPIGDRRVILVIDALDECEKIRSATALIQTLTDGLRQSHVKMLVTSRPEKAIVEAFDHVPTQTLTQRNVEDAVVTSDIRLFYERSFADIEREQGLTVKWYSSEDLDVLTERAGSLFIYAATLIKFIGDERGDPELQLKKWIGREGNLAETETATDHLDELYVQILRAAVTDSSGNLNAGYKTRIEQLVSTIVVSQTPLSLRALTILLEANEREVRSDVRALSSVVSFSDVGPIQIFHPSFADFVLSQKRCEKVKSAVVFEIGPRHAWFTTRCLSIMSSALHRNMCSLESPSRLNSEVPDLMDRVGRAFSEELRYACVHWMNHVVQMDRHGELAIYRELYSFCDLHLAHWMESLSLLQELRHALQDLPEVVQSVKISGDLTADRFEADALAEVLSDALRATQKFWEGLTQAALQVYVTLPVFLPECRLLKQLQKSDASYSSTLVTPRAPHWGPTAHIFSGGNSPLTSVVITKDGKFIFAGSKDMVLRRWNAHTGEVMLMSTSQPHEDEFLSGLHNLALSSDETRVISASHEETIRVWEASSLVVLYEFEHHKQRVESMKVISGDRVVSTDIAGMLYVWDLRSGIIHLSFKLDYAVQTFACSPDSKTLAHGGISIVTLRDLRSGETTMTLTMPREKRGKGPHRTLAPREGARMAIAFSSDGTYLLNSDWDGHIWLWLASTGTLIDVIPGPFPVSSMQNTFNQSTIILRRASMYNEGDIWIYDLGRREVTGSLRDACGGISPLDGACIINGDSADRLVTPCSDGNLRLWQLSDVFETPVPDVGHGSGRLVDHVKFVDKGELVISISRNGTGNRALNIWDARCGKVLTGPNCTLSWCINAIELKEQHHFLLIDSRFARVWDWKTNSIVRTWKTRGMTIFSQSASTRDCEYVAVTAVELADPLDEAIVTIYRVASGDTVAQWSTGMKQEQIREIAFDSTTLDLIGRDINGDVCALWLAKEHYPLIGVKSAEEASITPISHKFFGSHSGWLSVVPSGLSCKEARKLCWVPPELRWPCPTKSRAHTTALSGFGPRVAFGSISGSVTILNFAEEFSCHS